jgi:2'-5' RNA ligase
MQAVVSLLDDHFYELTEALWRELETRFGLRGVYATPYPHFSYHVAQNYDPDGIRSAFERLARATPPFQARTAGLGFFTGRSPVLYIPVVRTLALAQFHRALWAELAACAAGSLDYYDSDHWLPHITLASGDLRADALPEVVRLLAGRDFNWTITVNNLAHIVADPIQGQRLGFKRTLDGRGDD